MVKTLTTRGISSSNVFALHPFTLSQDPHSETLHGDTLDRVVDETVSPSVVAAGLAFPLPQKNPQTSCEDAVCRGPGANTRQGQRRTRCALPTATKREGSVSTRSTDPDLLPAQGTSVPMRYIQISPSGTPPSNTSETTGTTPDVVAAAII